MALTVRPVDGLIHRLLQNGAPPSLRASGERPAAVRNDQISISGEARVQARQASPERSEPAHPATNAAGSSALERHLLRIYGRSEE